MQLVQTPTTIFYISFEGTASIGLVHPIDDSEPWVRVSDIAAIFGERRIHAALRQEKAHAKMIQVVTANNEIKLIRFMSFEILCHIAARSRNNRKAGSVEYRFRRWLFNEIVPNIYLGVYVIKEAKKLGIAPPSLLEASQLPRDSLFYKRFLGNSDFNVD